MAPEEVFRLEREDPNEWIPPKQAATAIRMAQERLQTSEALCEGIVRHLETMGEEVFEKNFMQGGEIRCSVFCIIGPNAAEMTALVREWLNANGFKRGK